jgi:integrase
MHQSSFEPHDSTRLSGSRPLTPREERCLVRHIRRINARDRALISAQMFLGFRISEVLALTIGHVLLNGQIRTRVALPPRFLKGRRGTTRSVPIGPELRRALERYLARQARRTDLSSNAALFPSSHRDSNGNTIAIGRSSAEKIIKRALRRISPDPQGLSTHSLRKSWAVRLYEASGHNLLIVRDGLGHRSVAVTQVYLPTARCRVDELILKSDWTHRKPRTPKLVPIPTTATQRTANDKTAA